MTGTAQVHDAEPPARPTTTVDVSVVVPAFRAAGFIDRALESALSQSGVSVEVVVVDDACPQGTADVVRERYGSRPDVVVTRLETNSGPAAARNAGFAAATGEWVAVLDADDAFTEGRLAHLVEAAGRLGADVVADNVRTYDAATGAVSEPRLRSVTEPTLLDVHDLAAGGRPGTGELDLGLLKPMFRREFVRQAGATYPTQVRHGEDFLFYLELLHAGARFAVLPEAGYLWTLRSSGNSQTPVDYRAQVVDTRRLQRDERVRGDARLVGLLEERARALARLHHAQQYAEALREGRYARAALACVRHPRLLRYVARSVGKRLRRG